MRDNKGHIIELQLSSIATYQFVQMPQRMSTNPHFPQNYREEATTPDITFEVHASQADTCKQG